MLDFLSMIGDFIGFIIQAIGMLVTSLFALIQMVPQVIVFLLSLVTYVPPFLTPFLLAGVSIVAMKAVMGREK